MRERLTRFSLVDAVDQQNLIYDYPLIAARMLRKPAPDYRRFPCVTLGWDNTPCRETKALILNNFTLSAYESWLRSTIWNTAA